jgi:hypothetical protein
VRAMGILVLAGSWSDRLAGTYGYCSHKRTRSALRLCAAATRYCPQDLGSPDRTAKLPKQNKRDHQSCPPFSEVLRDRT